LFKYLMNILMVGELDYELLLINNYILLSIKFVLGNLCIKISLPTLSTITISL
jgi:hypothetical protein